MAHREELGIMKLVGATNWFVRAPFILEGIFYALAASVLASVMLWGTVVVSAPYVNSFLQDIPLSCNSFSTQNCG